MERREGDVAAKRVTRTTTLSFLLIASLKVRPYLENMTKLLVQKAASSRLLPFWFAAQTSLAIVGQPQQRHTPSTFPLEVGKFVLPSLKVSNAACQVFDLGFASIISDIGIPDGFGLVFGFLEAAACIYPRGLFCCDNWVTNDPRTQWPGQPLEVSFLSVVKNRNLAAEHSENPQGTGTRCVLLMNRPGI